jgi:glucose-6-phosphate 1-epimerase
MEIVEIRSDHGSARISSKGAHVLTAVLARGPLLWLSPQGESQAATPGAAVRGGVPVCFPWFGRHPDGRPAHGFARNVEWRVAERAADRVVFALDDDAATMALWPHRFHAELAIRVDDRLRFGFAVTNTDATPFACTYALHSYLSAPVSPELRVDGLDGCARHEDGQPPVRQTGPVPVGGAIDALFDGVPDTIVLRGTGDTIVVEAQDLPSAVVWNPGSGALPDVGDQWRDFACVERGRIGAAAVRLAPGETHRTSMTLLRQARD